MTNHHNNAEAGKPKGAETTDRNLYLIDDKHQMYFNYWIKTIKDWDEHISATDLHHVKHFARTLELLLERGQEENLEFDIEKGWIKRGSIKDMLLDEDDNHTFPDDSDYQAP